MSPTVTSYTPSEFSLTDSAIEHFSANLEGKSYSGIRLSVSESSGCSGYTYGIDYVEGVNEGIKFLNPNVKAICGCGESFEVDL